MTKKINIRGSKKVSTVSQRLESLPGGVISDDVVLADKKFSDFAPGGTQLTSDTVVGLRAGVNTKFNASPQVVTSWNGSASPVAITAGTGVTITGGVISSTVHALAWSIVSSNLTMTAYHGYFTNGGSMLLLTLPATQQPGDTIIVAGFGIGGWQIVQNSNNQILFGDNSTTHGTGGYLQNSMTSISDVVTIVSMDSIGNWKVISSIGSSIIIV